MANRQGFTIVEVLVALVVLAVVLVGLQTATGQLLHAVAESDRQLLARQLVDDRIKQIQLDPAYTLLASRYGGEEKSLPDAPGLTRVTDFLKVRDSTSAGIVDFWRITVRVDGTGLAAPVARTITVGAP